MILSPYHAFDVLVPVAYCVPLNSAPGTNLLLVTFLAIGVILIVSKMAYLLMERVDLSASIGLLKFF